MPNMTSSSIEKIDRVTRGNPTTGHSRPFMPPVAAKRLEITLKCDTIGSKEAILAAIQATESGPVSIRVIHSGVGAISKSDLDLAATGSRLVIGFNVGVHPAIPRLAHDLGIEVRLYQVIYRLLDDLKQTAKSLSPTAPEETITGKAKIIALFKSSRKGIILGCEVTQGVLDQGDRFRVITAMGPVYSGRIEAMHIGKDVVKEGRKGQQVGLKISNFNHVKVGDWVEAFTIGRTREPLPWRPKPGIMRAAA
jgi:translation initiation factor IF-2